MALDLNSLGTSTATSATSTINTTDQGILDKDDFLKLLLVELENQDPTSPKDSDKILEQTSQLATLEASTNTQDTLSDLASTISASSQFSAISAIGKMADLGTNGVEITEETVSDINFDLYFPDDVSSAIISIKSANGSTVRTMEVSDLSSGTSNFTWDRKNSDGNLVDAGEYSIEANYITANGNESKTTKFGVYPIEAIRFAGSEAELKLSSGYIPLSSVAEIYE
jgi:flagellar basal-body rod modification protein FlgD